MYYEFAGNKYPILKFNKNPFNAFINLLAFILFQNRSKSNRSGSTQKKIFLICFRRFAPKTNYKSNKDFAVEFLRLSL